MNDTKECIEMIDILLDNLVPDTKNTIIKDVSADSTEFVLRKAKELLTNYFYDKNL